MAFCLPKNIAEELKSRLAAREITPERLIEMSSQQRREYFETFMSPENAREVNLRLERKLILKNQIRGIENWVKEITGEKVRAKRDIISRAQRMEEILTPETEQEFLEDLVEARLGIGVTMEEAGKIAEMAREIKILEEKRTESEDARLEYGAAVVAFNRYVQSIVENTAKTELYERFRANPAKAIRDGLLELFGSSKTMKGTLDNSYVGRQGIKAMWAHPKIWWKHAIRSFSVFAKSLKGEEYLDVVNSYIFSRENYINGTYKRARLAVSTVEESFPSTLPERLPVVGRLVRASNAAFTMQAHLTRVDVFELYLKKAEQMGQDINREDVLRSIGKLVNSLTGRGDLGRFEPAADAFNNIFFSPRFFKSNIDILLQPIFGAGGNAFVRKQAAINLLRMVSGTLAVLLVADAVGDDDTIEWDLRSADFGKIRVGDTRIDITGGVSSLLTLAARLATMETKSSTTGRVRSLRDAGFGQSDGWDVLIDFSVNKLSPPARVIKNYLSWQMSDGREPTLWGQLNEMFLPIPIENAKELMEEPNAAPFLAGIILDGLGFGTNTYGLSNYWARSKSKEMRQFREFLGEKEFTKAAREADALLNEWYAQFRKTERYARMTDEERQREFRKQKDRIKRRIFIGYRFRPKK